MAQLRSHQTELEDLGVAVFVVTFGETHWAEIWRKETQSPFPLLLDRNGSTYRAYGLERSVLRSLSPKVFVYYFRLLWKGRKLKSSRGDPYQLGGDFLVDSQGRIRLAHPSRDPTDRPDLGRLLEVCRDLEPVARERS